MHFSLIVPTVGRVEPLGKLLASLDAQTCREFDLSVVDQNADDRIVPILDQYAGRFPIRRMSSPRGASRARNAGMIATSGDVVVFPDDDCWYPPDLLERVSRMLKERPTLDAVTGRPDGDPYWDKTAGPIDRFNVWKRGIEFTLFLRRRLVDEVGLLDEKLGPGSGTSYWAGEGADYLLRALDQGFVIEYDPDIRVYHPSSITAASDMEAYARKAYHYALAKGRVLTQRRLPSWFVAYQWFRPVAGAGWALLHADVSQAKLYWTVARGMVRGSMERASAS